jgi:hypothetical protein
VTPAEWRRGGANVMTRKSECDVGPNGREVGVTKMVSISLCALAIVAVNVTFF